MTLFSDFGDVTGLQKQSPIKKKYQTHLNSNILSDNELLHVTQPLHVVLHYQLD